MNEQERHQWAVDVWNACVPEGSQVELTKDNGDKVLTTTRSEAWLLASGTPVVLVECASGGWLIYRLKVVKP